MDDATTLVDILASGSADSLHAKFASPELSGYLSHITSLALSDLLQEPTNLSSEAAQLSNSLTSLCHAEYSTFLSLQRTSSVLSETLNAFSDSLSSLLDSLPELETQARKFTSQTQDIQAERRKANLLLEQHDKLADVLEIPQLIETCVRNAHYQDAMDLAAHASALAIRFPKSAVVQDVAAEAAQATRLMLAQLLNLLRSPAKLPALFKAVAVLRKTGLLEEPALALAFLASRRAHISATLAAASSPGDNDPVRGIRRFIDAWREGVHDAVTHFTTIFLERADAPLVLHTLLSPFAYDALAQLRAALSDALPRIDDAGALASLLTALTYCAASCARIGMDFRALLPPLFESAVSQRFARAVNDAVTTFASSTSDAQKAGRAPAQWLVTAAAAASGAPPTDVPRGAPAHIAPPNLASYPPLAELTNAVLGALNALRQLAPTALLCALLDALDAALARAAAVLLAYVRRVDEGSSELDGQVLRAAGTMLVTALVPFSRRALYEGVYGVQEDPGLRDDLAAVLKEWDSWLSVELS